VVGTALANDPSSLLGGGVPLVTPTGLTAFRLVTRYQLVVSALTDVTHWSDGEIWTYGAGIALPDFGKEGNLLGVFAGVEPTLRYLEAAGDQDFDNEYGYHIEGFYRYRLTDNISITPGVIWLTSPGQNETTTTLSLVRSERLLSRGVGV